MATNKKKKSALCSNVKTGAKEVGFALKKALLLENRASRVGLADAPFRC